MIYTLNEKRKSLAGNPILAEAERIELAVLLCLSELGEADVATLSEAASCEEADVLAALQFWRGARMVRTVSDKKSTPSAEGVAKKEDAKDEKPKQEVKKIHAA